MTPSEEKADTRNLKMNIADLDDAETKSALQQAKAAKKNARSIRSLTRRSKETLVLAPSDVEAATNAEKLRARQIDIGLKRLLAWVAIIAVSLQLVVSDFFLIHYAVLSHREPSETVLVAWLSASVVEVIGVVAIIARNLFPNRGRRGRRRRRRSNR